jgi:hypothetical protein
MLKSKVQSTLETSKYNYVETQVTKSTTIVILKVHKKFLETYISPWDIVLKISMRGA